MLLRARDEERAIAAAEINLHRRDAPEQFVPRNGLRVGRRNPLHRRRCLG